MLDSIDLLTSLNFLWPSYFWNENVLALCSADWVENTFTQGLVMMIFSLLLFSWYFEHVFERTTTNNHVFDIKRTPFDITMCFWYVFWPTTNNFRGEFVVLSILDLNCMSMYLWNPKRLIQERLPTKIEFPCFTPIIFNTCLKSHTKIIYCKTILGLHSYYSSYQSPHPPGAPVAAAFDDISHHRLRNEACKGLDTHREATKPPAIWANGGHGIRNTPTPCFLVGWDWYRYIYTWWLYHTWWFIREHREPWFEIISVWHNKIGTVK